jgi:capsular polysaccharide biosynthesis protein
MNLGYLLEIVRKRWMQSLGLVVAATLITGLILFLQKPIFRSSAIFTAANPNLGDRANIYRTQFWEQYFYYGSEFDNDRLMAMAYSEDMFRTLADSFQLKKHYKIKVKGERGRYLTDKEFKENVRIHKNEYGHVKVSVWDKDKYLATKIANAFMYRINQKAVTISNQMKQEILLKLQADYQAQKDSLTGIEANSAFAANDFLKARHLTIIQELNEKEKLIQQFQTSINNVAALFVIEEAVPAFRKEKPLVLNGMITAAILSFVFSVLLVIFLEWNATKKS